MLIAARVLLGFGTSAAYPAAMHLTRSEAERTGHDSPSSVLTVLAVSSQTVAVVGPTLGGLLIGAGGWRTIFTVNVPLSLACLVLGALRLPKASEAAAVRADEAHGYHVTLATDAMADLDAEAHRHSVARVFPRLGETGTTAEVVELLAKTRV